MERRKLLLHIDREEEDEASKTSSTSRLFIECPRIVYTAFCFALFLSTCLFLLVLFILLLLLNDSNKQKENNTPKQYPGDTTTKIVSTTEYRSKQSMFEYLRGIKKNKTSPLKSKNLTQTCLNLQADDEYGFNNWTKNNIYFVKPADEVIDERFACTVESCLLLNPYKRVYILNMEPDGSRHIRETQQSHFNYLKSFYKNLKSKDIYTESYFKELPFDTSKFKRDSALMKPLIELVTLWKYSGLVNSRQNLLLSRSFYNQSTILLEKSVYYSSYARICSPVLEKFLWAFKAVTDSHPDNAESMETIDDMVNSAIDSLTNESVDADIQKLGLFQVCSVMKPSCYFVNVDCVWKLNKINMATYCPKMVELSSSSLTEGEKTAPVFVPQT